MTKVAIALLTKDRVDLTTQMIKPLLQPDKFDLFWIDGSVTQEGETAWAAFPSKAVRFSRVFGNVKGGPDAAIVFALTTMLADKSYDYVGIIEQDVLLDGDWFEPTMELFNSARVGAASPRCYEDRILIQRDGYAVMHNLGAGCVIFERAAANTILFNYRTGFSIDNRTVFMQRSGIDIGAYWAFRGQTHWLTADWHFDVALARAGLCSLALTPSKAQMIGQNPSLELQGLKLAAAPVEARRDDAAFDRFRSSFEPWFPAAKPIHVHQGQQTFFPHQLYQLGAVYEGEWRLKWAQGFGPFAWQSTQAGNKLTIPLSGVCDMLVSGGKEGGTVEVADTHSGYVCAPQLLPEGANTAIMSLPLPCGVSYRTVTLTARSPGIVFYGIRTLEPQVFLNSDRFDYSHLPPAG